MKGLNAWWCHAHAWLSFGRLKHWPVEILDRPKGGCFTKLLHKWNKTDTNGREFLIRKLWRAFVFSYSGLKDTLPSPVQSKNQNFYSYLVESQPKKGQIKWWTCNKKTLLQSYKRIHPAAACMTLHIYAAPTGHLQWKTLHEQMPSLRKAMYHGRQK